MTVLLENRKARFEYFIEETLECGIVLKGTEVKSLKGRNANFNDGYISINEKSMNLMNTHISPYKFAFKDKNHEPLRNRALLAHKKEIIKLFHKVKVKGYALIPLNFHFCHGKIKLTIGLCKGKKLHDKRESIKKRDLAREARRERVLD